MNNSRRFIFDKSFRLVFAFLNINETRVLQKAKLPIDLFEKRVISLSTEQYFGLWTAILEQSDSDEPIPLKFEKIPLFASMSVPVMAALCSPDFITFCKRIREYKPLIGPLNLDLQEKEDKFSLEITHIDENQKLHPLIIATEFVFFLKMIRYATEKDITPICIESTESIVDPAYSEYFGVTPCIGDKNKIVLSIDDAKTPFKFSDQSVWDRFEPELRKRLHELEVEVDTSFSAKVRAVLMELLPLGKLSIDCVSEKLCISSRTLQRKLKNENTNYQQQLNHCRELLAKHYLGSTDMSITEISFLLGYEEPSSFTRAFNVWIGQSPEHYREKST